MHVSIRGVTQTSFFSVAILLSALTQNACTPLLEIPQGYQNPSFPFPVEILEKLYTDQAALQSAHDAIQQIYANAKLRRRESIDAANLAFASWRLGRLEEARTGYQSAYHLGLTDRSTRLEKLRSERSLFDALTRSQSEIDAMVSLDLDLTAAGLPLGVGYNLVLAQKSAAEGVIAARVGLARKALGIVNAPNFGVPQSTRIAEARTSLIKKVLERQGISVRKPSAREVAQIEVQVRESARLLDVWLSQMNLAREDHAKRRFAGETVDAVAIAQSESATDLMFHKSLGEIVTHLEFSEPELERARVVDQLSAHALEEAQSNASTVGSLEATQIALSAKLASDEVLVDLVRYAPLDPRDYQPTRQEATGDNYPVFAPPNMSNDEPTQPSPTWRYVAYLLRPNGHPKIIDLGPAKGIDQLAADFGRALRNYQSDDATKLGRSVYDMVLQPVLMHVDASVNTLRIVPDSQLNLIPFGAAILPDGRYLLEQYHVSYLQRAEELLRTTHASPSAREVVVIAAPEFERSGEPQRAPPATRAVELVRNGFDSLPAAQREADAIAKVFPGAKVLTGWNASEAQLRKIKQPGLLSMITHGFFLPDVTTQTGLLGPEAKTLLDPMMRSGLAFAGANEASGDGEHDGILTAYEAVTLDLYGTQLVVLSACETGLGEATNGQGVYGLRRAFAIAGAESIAMSLWEVEDDATAELMTTFYQALKAGKGRAESLREAQLSMLRKYRNTPGTKVSRAHPFFWGAFVLSGNTGPVVGIKGAKN